MLIFFIFQTSTAILISWLGFDRPARYFLKEFKSQGGRDVRDILPWIEFDQVKTNNGRLQAVN